jgi:hypothetical protein
VRRAQALNRPRPGFNKVVPASTTQFLEESFDIWSGNCRNSASPEPDEQFSVGRDFVKTAFFSPKVHHPAGILETLMRLRRPVCLSRRHLGRIHIALRLDLGKSCEACARPKPRNTGALSRSELACCDCSTVGASCSTFCLSCARRQVYYLHPVPVIW